MCHSLLFGLLLGAFVTRLFIRRRHFFSGLHGGACGHGAQDGGPGGPCGGGWRGRGAERFARFARFAEEFAAQNRGQERPGRAVNLGELVRDLELNSRQQEEAQPVLTLLREQLGASHLRLRGALSAVASEIFDRARVEAIVADLPPEQRKQLAEGLEHLHDILIPEQREVLRDRLQGGAAASSQGPSTLL